MSVAIWKRVTATRVLALVVSLALAGSAQTAFGGGAIGVVSLMKSQGPCPYALQLQSSETEKKNYLAKLAAAKGGPVSYTGSSNEESSGDSDNYFASALGTTTLQKETPVGVDAFSADCVACHDGASAVQVQVNWRNSPYGGGHHNAATSTDHPIGMEYENYAAAAPRKYKHVGDTRLVFINGRVGCLTCHDPLNSERGHLVKSDRKSALCLTCHNK